MTSYWIMTSQLCHNQSIDIIWIQKGESEVCHVVPNTFAKGLGDQLCPAAMMAFIINIWRSSRTKLVLNWNLPLITLFLLFIIVSVILTILTLQLNRLNIQPNFYSVQPSQYEAVLYSQEEPDQPHSTKSKHVVAAVARPVAIYKHKSKNLKSIYALKPPYLPVKTLKSKWKVLRGNVVVHEGHVDNPHNYSYVINSEEACNSLNASDPVSVLIFVESNVDNFERRQIIRETWGLQMIQRSYNVKLVFMLGASSSNKTQDEVNKEFYIYGDVVQEDFKEHFKHLTLKTVMGLKWAQTYCQQATFVVKTDDDILIHLPNLFKSLLTYKNAKRLLLCHENHTRRIERMGKVYAKYQVSPFELPGNFFPAYCSGFTYIMSRDVVTSLYEASISTPYFFIEDVFVTGFCRHKAGIELLNDARIVLRPYVTSDSAPCDFSEGRITSQELSVQETKDIWSGINTRGYFCPVLVADLISKKKL
ncbi:hypothetical protein CHUAL_008802 [Chamberlinius hualienensis]